MVARNEDLDFPDVKDPTERARLLKEARDKREEKFLNKQDNDRKSKSLRKD